MKKFNKSTYFSVEATPRRYEPDDVLPSHSLIIRPILAAAVTMRMFGNVRDSYLREDILNLGSQAGSSFEFDLSKELVRGHERLWNLKAWERGGLVLVCDRARLDLGAIFDWCGSAPNVWEDAALRKMTPMAAIRFAQESVTEDRIAIHFPASNGIDWLDLFVLQDQAEASLRLAQLRCRRFKRWVEHNPEATNEIIVDRPPYAVATMGEVKS